jgi:hypothetical protein
MGLSLAERLALRKQQETGNAVHDNLSKPVPSMGQSAEHSSTPQTTSSNDGEGKEEIQSSAQETQVQTPSPPVRVGSSPANEKNSLVTNELVNAVKQEQSIDDLLDVQAFDRGILSQGAITVEDIVPRIEQLNSLSDMDAENEMRLLKAALMANPAAVSLMMPEHVGTLVSTLRRITKEAIVASEKPKKEKKASTKITANLELADDF